MTNWLPISLERPLISSPLGPRAHQLKGKGVDQIVILAANDPFVMSAWGRQNGAQDKLVFASDINLEFSKAIDATADLSAMGFGVRTGRYALIVDDLKVVDFAVSFFCATIFLQGAGRGIGRRQKEQLRLGARDELSCAPSMHPRRAGAEGG